VGVEGGVVVTVWRKKAKNPTCSRQAAAIDYMSKYTKFLLVLTHNFLSVTGQETRVAEPNPHGSLVRFRVA
jgi:hypothetical protein